MTHISRIPEGVRAVRVDLSDWLWHLVRRDGNEVATIRAILNSKSLMAHPDYFSKENVICFTEAPLADCIRQDRFLTDSGYTRLSLFGVGFQRPWLYERDALPVIYEPNSLLDSLPSQFRWRHVEFDLSKPVDFTWQREWRLHVDSLAFSEDDAILVIPDTDDLKDDLWGFNVDAEYEEGQVVLYGGYFNRWRFIPLEYEEIASDADIEVCVAKDHTDIIQDEYDDSWEYI